MCSVNASNENDNKKDENPDHKKQSRETMYPTTNNHDHWMCVHALLALPHSVTRAKPRPPYSSRRFALGARYACVVDIKPGVLRRDARVNVRKTVRVCIEGVHPHALPKKRKTAFRFPNEWLVCVCRAYLRVLNLLCSFSPAPSLYVIQMPLSHGRISDIPVKTDFYTSKTV